MAPAPPAPPIGPAPPTRAGGSTLAPAMPAPAPRHDHVFLGSRHARHEQRTRWVVALSFVVMVAELWGGWAYRSVALVADGLHMSTHAGALLVAAAAYAFARRRAHDPRFAFGTGKVGDLAAFASGVGLAVMAALIASESVGRLLHPETVAFVEAAWVAGLGAVVSLASAVLLHHHDDGGTHGHGHAEQDLNVWAAYLHMLADVVTSLLTVVALLVGAATGWLWLDPLVGLLGAALVASFAVTLLRRAGAVLLDMRPAGDSAEAVRARLEAEGDRVTDLHLWRVGPGHLALIAQVTSAHPREPDHYRRRLEGVAGLSHTTIEVVRAP